MKKYQKVIDLIAQRRRELEHLSGLSAKEIQIDVNSEIQNLDEASKILSKYETRPYHMTASIYHDNVEKPKVNIFEKI